MSSISYMPLLHGICTLMPNRHLKLPHYLPTDFPFPQICSHLHHQTITLMSTRQDLTTQIENPQVISASTPTLTLSPVQNKSRLKNRRLLLLTTSSALILIVVVEPSPRICTYATFTIQFQRFHWGGCLSIDARLRTKVICCYK